MLANLKDALRKRKTTTGIAEGRTGVEAGLLPHELSDVIYERRQATPEQRRALAKILQLKERFLFAKSDQQSADQQLAAGGQ